ncbi:restriction endonuclease subunit S [Helicobacter pylori]|uniref:restriction endonuclease subunit S n=1 Tax=Helicobacter pylori TaxID=210 RepID=UPI00165ADAF9|nr:restriction endonuclease subunit S [Helicobacter pylori]MBH0234870.1 restriction endonuclease subunit S [Helicobacter pylori]MBH0251358.1 restriction endonuclease subunit S [Helicobacter pylori]MBH0270537.1 restriction endonuclease subunit S [Helicobacter pylori]
MDALTTPSNWQRVRLGDIAEIKRGASPRPIENPKWFCANSNVGWVRISDISKNSRFLYKTAQKLSKKGIEKSRFIKQNSLIMSMCATIGKPIITKIDTCIHDGFVVFENPKIDLNYLYYFLCYIEKEWLESGQQGSQVNLNVDLIKNKEVFCPKDLNEQSAIANILSDVDHYLYSLDALILKKESVKKALSFELLSQRKRLKGFNQAWQRVRLGDIAEIKRGVRITKNELDVFGKYPVVSGGVGFLGYTNNFNRYENTITIAQYGTAGYVNFQKNKFWANDVCFCVYPNKDVIKNIFLYYFLKVNQNYLYEISNRNATPYSISKDKILDFEILLPPLNEQAAIANILSALDSEIISLKNKKRQFENIKKALNHDLMSAKIRVLKK